MKERPILFSGEMIRAILAGKKTQTRRVIKPQPGSDDKVGFSFFSGTESIEFRNYSSGTLQLVKNPYGKKGDRLWVRETWAKTPDDNRVIYRADYPVHSPMAEVIDIPTGRLMPLTWKPSIHLQRKFSRITLEITGVRVERVQEISEEGAIAEGIDYLFSEEDCQRVAGIIGSKPEDHGWKNYLWHGDYGSYGGGNKQSDSWPYQYSGYKTAVGSYSSLWEKINAKRGYSWKSNPFVFVIEFKKVKP